MSKKIEAAIKSGLKGFHIGTRMILPFKCQFIKVVAHNHIFTEFVGSSDIKVNQDWKNTSIYFREQGKLSQFEGSYEYIKMIVADLDEDLCDRNTHMKIVCSIKDNHEVEIALADDDVLFIE